MYNIINELKQLTLSSGNTRILFHNQICGVTRYAAYMTEKPPGMLTVHVLCQNYGYRTSYSGIQIEVSYYYVR